MSPEFTVPPAVRDNQQKRAVARRPMPCGAGVGRGLTCDQYPAVLYPCGYRCAACAERTGLTPVNHQEATA